MKTRIIHTRFWQDSFVTELDYKEKLVFIYLLTNEHIGLTGIYELPDKYIRFDLDISQAELDQIKTKLSQAGKVLFKNGWIKIIQHDKYNSYRGQKIEPAKQRELDAIPEEILNLNNTSIVGSMDTTSDTSNNHKSKTINHKSKTIYDEIEKISEDDLQEISEYYKVPLGFVKLQLEKLTNYCSSSGRKYKNYKSALRNFVLSDMQKVVTTPRKGGVVDGTNL